MNGPDSAGVATATLVAATLALGAACAASPATPASSDGPTTADGGCRATVVSSLLASRLVGSLEPTELLRDE